MFEIREYTDTDSERVGVLIADTYGEYNLGDMPPEKRRLMLGPFALARSPLPEHRKAIRDALAAPSIWVAEKGGEIVGVLRGGRTDGRGRTVLSSLFVEARHHRQGIGRALVARFENEYAAKGVGVFSLSATLHAAPFYSSVGYKKSTGVRLATSFGEPGLRCQPMRKSVGNGTTPGVEGSK